RREEPVARTGNEDRGARRGLGPFSSNQLTIIVCVGMLALVAAVPLVAGAALPNGNTYHGGANKKSRALRVVDHSKELCQLTEIPVNWSKAGAKGATGPQGRPGSDGAPGAKGATGATGATGAAGDPSSPLESGESESGVFALNGNDPLLQGFTYPRPLAAP